MAFGSNLLTVFDFAAGSGMLGEAVRLALDCIGVDSVPVGYVEREASAAAAIVAGLESQGLPRPAIWSDARTFDSQRFRGCVDIFCAGYPCQPFSFAGKRSGESDPRHLWPAVRDAIAEIEPGIVFLENVAGHVRLGYGAVERDLQRLGYTAFPGLFTAAEVGATHDRKRLFVLALSARWRPGEHMQRDGNSPSNTPDGDSRWSDFDGCDPPMADADRLQREHAGSSGQGGARGAVATAGEALANTDGQRRKGPKPEPNTAKTEDARAACRSDGIPVFPPGPGDLESWAVIASVDLSRMPAIESDVRGMADGLAPWSERVRMLGNGVVPLAAAYAFLSLFACASGE